MSLQIKRRRVLKDLLKKGLVTYVWVIDPETREQTKHLAVTDKARAIMNGLGRSEK